MCCRWELCSFPVPAGKALGAWDWLSAQPTHVLLVLHHMRMCRSHLVDQKCCAITAIQLQVLLGWWCCQLHPKATLCTPPSVCTNMQVILWSGQGDVASDFLSSGSEVARGSRAVCIWGAYFTHQEPLQIFKLFLPEDWGRT